MSKSPDNLFASIELGTHSIKVLLAEVTDNSLTILGSAETGSLKVVKGEVRNLNMVSEKLTQAIEKVENITGIELGDAFISLVLSGGYITQSVVTADVNIMGSDRMITEEDIARADKNARQKDIPKRMDVLDISTRIFTLSDGRQLLDPLGQVSSTLQISKLLIHARKERFNTPVNLVKQCLGHDINDITYAPIAIGKACISKEDLAKEGQICIDIGAGVTSYALFTTAGCHTAGQITVGFEQAANDLSIAFDLPIQYARNLLKKFDSLNLSVISANDGRTRFIDVERGPGTRPRRIAASSIEQVVQVRFSELFQIIKERLQQDNAWQLATGSVRLSGGAALLPGMTALAHDILAHDALIARPFNVTAPKEIITNPAFIVPIGALRNAKEALDSYNQQIQASGGTQESATTNILKALGKILNF